MSKGNVDENHLVKCPYYKCENRCTIFCEGVQAGQCIHMAFSGGEDKRSYEKQFCRKKWGDCIIAAGQNARYEYAP